MFCFDFFFFFIIFLKVFFVFSFEFLKNNNNLFGKIAIKAAEILDKTETLSYGYYPDITTPHGIIVHANEQTETAGLSGFMASAVVDIISECHERGNEFKEKYYNRK